MPASTGKTGIGVVLKVSDAVPATAYATIANVTQVSAGGVTLNMVDATHLDSPSFYAEKIPGLKTADDWTLTIQWDPDDATHSVATGLAKQLEDRVSRYFVLDTNTLGWSEGLKALAFVSNWGAADTTPEGIITRSVTLSVTGAVTAEAMPLVV